MLPNVYGGGGGAEALLQGIFRSAFHGKGLLQHVGRVAQKEHPVETYTMEVWFGAHVHVLLPVPNPSAAS